MSLGGRQHPPRRNNKGVNRDLVPEAGEGIEFLVSSAEGPRCQGGCGVFSKKLLCVVGPFMANGSRVGLSRTNVYSLIVLTKLPFPPFK